MGQYAGSNSAWIDEVYQFEETDVVLGGPDGVDNVPLKNLADRTAWLKAQIGIFDRLAGEKVINANANITNVDAGKLIVAVAAGVLTLTLADVTTFAAGSIIPVSSFCGADSVVYIQGQPGQKFYDAGSGRDKMYMHDKEFLWLKASTGGWKIIGAHGNFNCAGEEVKARKILQNTLSFLGQELQRNLYPRLLEFVQSLPSNAVVSESTWFSDAIRYRGFFTLGNGVSTFRLPDERAMFDRMLDLGRGIDISRYPNYPGGYEADEIKAHGHDVVIPKRSASGNDGTNSVLSSIPPGSGNIVKKTELTGGPENLVKNIGKYNLIKY